MSDQQTQRETKEIVRSLLDDTQLFVKKHIELAKLEMLETIDARLKGAIAGAAAGVMALFGLGFLAAAAAYGLDTVMAAWLARLIVGGAFLLLAAVGALIGRRKMVEPPMTPERTVETLKEDKGWARAQLRR